MGKTGMVRHLGVVATAAMVTLVGSSCAIGDQSEADPVVIGADLELTGSGSELGSVYRNALELKVAQVNEQGLLGDRRLELDVRDNRSDGATAATNVAELAGDPDVDAIITGGCVSCAVAVAEAASDLAVPVIALAGPDVVSEPVEERRYLFKLGPDADHIANALVSELGNGVETIGLVTVGDAYGEEGASAMAAAADRGGVEIVVQESITADEQSIASAAAAVIAYQVPVDPLAELTGDVQAQQGPDAVAVWAPSALAGSFVAELRRIGYEGGLYLDAAAAGNLFLTGEQSALPDGVTMIFTETLVIDEVIATSPARAARKNWFSEYSAQFGSYHAFSSFAADAVQLVVNAVNEGGGTDDPEVLRNIIETAQMEGLTGTIRMSPRQHSGLMPQALVPLVARDDRWRLG